MSEDLFKSIGEKLSDLKHERENLKVRITKKIMLIFFH